MVFFKVASIILLLLLLIVIGGDAKSYTVGDTGGWSFVVGSWPTNKIFYAGDELTFNYPRIFHNVVRVNQPNFDNCTAPANAVVHQSGSDKMKLKRGHNYFMCAIPFHCNLGMKLAVLSN